MKTCTRISAAGGTCGHLTDNADAWCRREDCTGRRTAEIPPQPPQLRAKRMLHGLPIDGYRPAGPVPLDCDEAWDVRITVRCVEGFVAAHGGTGQAAEAELRSMLEDFLRTAKTGRNRHGFWALTYKGYRLVLSPNCNAVTKYQTAHAERSWSQFKAKVPSRYPGAKGTQRRRAGADEVETRGEVA